MKNIDWDILVHHLAGTSTKIEESRLAAWMSEKDENRIFVQRLEKVWAMETASAHHPDTEQALNRVLTRIHHAAPTEDAVARMEPAPRNIVHIFTSMSRSYVFRIAAAIVLVVGAFALYRIATTTQDSSQTAVKFGSMQSLELPDGTKVTCDVGSTFAYPKSFGSGGHREVFLKGEAYFDVARDEHRPFVVHADGGKIEVLGTKFNVRAWETDRHIVVAVKEGKVSFQAENNTDSKNIVFLSENNMSTLARGASPLPPEMVDLSAIASWMKKEIYFRNTPVPEVLHQLERWYGVTIGSADSVFLRSNITVFIENKPLTENLRLISATMNVRYEQHGDSVQFHPN
jgi:transmembrane sensor